MEYCLHLDITLFKIFSNAVVLKRRLHKHLPTDFFATVQLPCHLLINTVVFAALMYCSINTAIEKARGTEDMYNSVAAAVTTGALFKSTGMPCFVARWFLFV